MICRYRNYHLLADVLNNLQITKAQLQLLYSNVKIVTVSYNQEHTVGAANSQTIKPMSSDQAIKQTSNNHAIKQTSSDQTVKQTFNSLLMVATSADYLLNQSSSSAKWSDESQRLSLTNNSTSLIVTDACDHKHAMVTSSPIITRNENNCCVSNSSSLSTPVIPSSVESSVQHDTDSVSRCFSSVDSGSNDKALAAGLSGSTFINNTSLLKKEEQGVKVSNKLFIGEINMYGTCAMESKYSTCKPMQCVAADYISTKEISDKLPKLSQNSFKDCNSGVCSSETVYPSLIVSKCDGALESGFNNLTKSSVKDIVSKVGAETEMKEFVELDNKLKCLLGVSTEVLVDNLEQTISAKRNFEGASNFNLSTYQQSNSADYVYNCKMEAHDLTDTKVVFGKSIETTTGTELSTVYVDCSKVKTVTVDCSELDAVNMNSFKVNAGNMNCSKLNTTLRDCSKLSAINADCSKLDDANANCSKLDAGSVPCSNLIAVNANSSKLNATNVNYCFKVNVESVVCSDGIGQLDVCCDDSLPPPMVSPCPALASPCLTSTVHKSTTSLKLGTRHSTPPGCGGIVDVHDLPILEKLGEESSQLTVCCDLESELNTSDEMEMPQLTAAFTPQ